jgi:hypothetical protein
VILTEELLAGNEIATTKYRFSQLRTFFDLFLFYHESALHQLEYETLYPVLHLGGETREDTGPDPFYLESQSKH